METAETIAAFLENEKKHLVFSAYQVLAQKAERRAFWHGGITNYWPPSAPVTEHTWFDIGSVTKAVATASILARLVDQRAIDLNATLGHYVQALKATAVGELVLRDVLCHASGLKPWLRLELGTSKSLAGWLKDHSADWIQAAPGVKTAYSDLGFLCLGLVVEAVSRCPFSEAFQKEVVGPLKLTEVAYRPLPVSAVVAATEVRENRPLVGEVFDENSQALGGITPHAGLFATARGLAPWCMEWLKAVAGESEWLSSETAVLFTRRADRVAHSSWALGWDTKSEVGSSAGKLFSARSFGHLGYPGCSVWVDPEQKGFVVFLTNRVHPSRLDERIRKTRPLLHDKIVHFWG